MWHLAADFNNNGRNERSGRGCGIWQQISIIMEEMKEAGEDVAVVTQERGDGAAEDVVVTEERGGGAAEDVEVIEPTQSKPKQPKKKKDVIAIYKAFSDFEAKRAGENEFEEAVSMMLQFNSEELMDVDTSRSYDASALKYEKMYKVFMAMRPPDETKSFSHCGNADGEGSMRISYREDLGLDESGEYRRIAWDTANFSKFLMKNVQDIWMVVSRVVILVEEKTGRVMPGLPGVTVQNVKRKKPAWSSKIWSYGYFMKVRKLYGVFAANPEEKSKYQTNVKSADQVYNMMFSHGGKKSVSGGGKGKGAGSGGGGGGGGADKRSRKRRSGDDEDDSSSGDESGDDSESGEERQRKKKGVKTAMKKARRVVAWGRNLVTVRWRQCR